MKNEPQSTRELEIPGIVSDLDHINGRLVELIIELEERLLSVLSEPEPKDNDEKGAAPQKKTSLGETLYVINIGIIKSFERLEDLKKRLEV